MGIFSQYLIAISVKGLLYSSNANVSGIMLTLQSKLNSYFQQVRDAYKRETGLKYKFIVTSMFMEQVDGAA